MEGDTLDDQDTNCNGNFQEAVANSPHEEDIARVLMPMATDKMKVDISQLPSSSKNICSPTVISSQSINCISSPVVLSNPCTSTSETVTTSIPGAHVSSPIVITSSHVSSSVSTLSAHVSSPLVTVGSSVANTSLSSLPVNTISYALTLLAQTPYSVITSLPLSFVANDISSAVLSSLSSSSSSPNCHHVNTSRPPSYNPGKYLLVIIQFT